MNKIELVIENLDGQRVHADQGMTLAEVARQYVPKGQYPWIAALVNNQVEPLSYVLYNPKRIRFIDITSEHGLSAYQNSIVMMLAKAVRDVYPQASLQVVHSMTTGFHCSIEGVDGATRLEVVKAVRDRMTELQRMDIPFYTRTMLVEDAARLMEEHHASAATLETLRNCGQLYVHVHLLDGMPRIMASVPVPSTGCLTCWDFKMQSESGYLLQWPDRQYPEKLSVYEETPKLFSIFEEHRRWVNTLGVPTIEDLNRVVRDKGENHLIQVSEALHEKKYAEIAEMIYQRRDSVRMVLLAGPSSSGKTTSCRRLSVQLSVLGFDVQQLSLDDYFVDRSRTPKQPNGDYDFEALEALDIPMLNDHLNRLFKGERVEIPTYDFKKGEPYFSGKALQLKPESILVVEGIHALNPKLTAQVDDGLKFKVYVSALTQIAIDDLNLIRTSDNRLIRRIVRDNNFRGWGAQETIMRWPSVRAGERQHIFPYQENADVMFNSALLYELGVLRNYAEPQLKRVPQNS
ncbi:MAG: nucleoside kinase, partial [Bacteroidales bacterium]|nr:nucleoside kinase [Bacteroidales bacterium]